MSKAKYLMTALTLAQRVDARQLDLAMPLERLGARLRQPDELDRAQAKITAAAGDRIS